jgi:hypothetical protein
LLDATGVDPHEAGWPSSIAGSSIPHLSWLTRWFLALRLGQMEPLTVT